MQRRPTVRLRFRVDCVAYCLIRTRQTGDAPRKGTEIHHRAPDEQRYYTARGKDLVHFPVGIAHELARRVALFRIEEVDQAMRRALERRCIRFGRANVHAAINERRIDADDVAGKSLAKPNCEVGLARRRGAHQQNGLPLHRRYQRPRRNSRSSSLREIVVQVGRP